MKNEEYVKINNKKFGICKYLSANDSNYLLNHVKGIFSLWHKANDFGLTYKYLYLGKFKTHRKEAETKVMLIHTSKGYSLSLIYGWSEHLELVETSKFTWYDNPSKWSKISKEASI